MSRSETAASLVHLVGGLLDLEHVTQISDEASDAAICLVSVRLELIHLISSDLEAIPSGISKYYAIAAFTRSGVNGTVRMRTPVASKTALPSAAATGAVEASPAP